MSWPLEQRPVFLLLDAAKTPQAGVQPQSYGVLKESKTQPIPHESLIGVVHWQQLIH